MKLTSASGETASLGKIIRHARADGRVPNITFIYQDAQSRIWARELFERIAKPAHNKGLKATWWRMSDLIAPGVLAGAVSVAMRADIIVVATSEAEGLPVPFYVWVQQWLPHRFQRSGALVAVLGAQQPPLSQPGRVEQYLRAVGRQSRLAFVLQERRLPGIYQAGIARRHLRERLAELFSTSPAFLIQPI